MRAVVQRVTEASVSVDGETVGAIGPGLCVLVGVAHDDDDATARKIAEKLWNLRCFDDADGVMNVSAADAGLPLLVISQFTLYADTRKGRRPSWSAAAPAEVAAPLPAGDWQVAEEFAETSAAPATVREGRLVVALASDFSARVTRLRRAV